MNRRRSTVAYNPHLLGRDELVAGFIARQPLLDEIVDDLRRGGAQHHLLIGQRGSGKTTLLLRIACSIEDDRKLSRGAIALRFPEEQYNVGRVSDLWLNCIDALVDALELRGEGSEARAIEVASEPLAGLKEADRAYESLKLLTGWAKKAKRNLVLLIDNFDLILDRLDKDHWALRETLSADNRLVLIGASSTFIQESFAYESPFYDFFNVHELGGLSETEAHSFVLRLAALSGTPQVTRALEVDPGRFRALYMLSGGAPRTLALLNNVLAHEDVTRAELDLERLLDGLTPYYKARFDDLAAQSQLVVDAVALHWHPITAAECAARLQMDVNTVSAQLNRLVRQGLLSKVLGAEAGRLTFQVSERFFNIWYLMRASRRMRRNLFWLVGFLQTFYGDAEIERRATALLESDAGRAAASSGPSRLLAFASAVKDGRLRRRLEFRAVEMIVERRLNRGALADILDLQGEDAHLVTMLDRARILRDVRGAILNAKAGWPRVVNRAEFAQAVAANPWFSGQMKSEIARVIESGGAKVRALVLAIVDAERPLSEFTDPALQEAVGRGEVPSIADVNSVEDVDQIAALASDASRAYVVAFMAANLPARSNVREGLAEYIVRIEPQALAEYVAACGRLVKLPRWGVVRKRMVAVLGSTSHEALPVLSSPDVWKAFVKAGAAAEAATLLNESGSAERLAPTYAALVAASHGIVGEIAGLAPEVSGPAATILAAFHAEDPQEDAEAGVSSPMVPPRTQRRRTSKSSASRRPLG